MAFRPDGAQVATRLHVMSQRGWRLAASDTLEKDHVLDRIDQVYLAEKHIFFQESRYYYASETCVPSHIELQLVLVDCLPGGKAPGHFQRPVQLCSNFLLPRLLLP